MFFDGFNSGLDISKQKQCINELERNQQSHVKMQRKRLKLVPHISPPSFIGHLIQFNCINSLSNKSRGYTFLTQCLKPT